MVTDYRYCVGCGAANTAHDAICFACGQSLKTTLPLSAEQLEDCTIHLLKERYHILAQVGKGGFATVYKARDTHFDNQLVAIKEIRLSGLKAQDVITATEAFNRETLLLSGLKHPNLPRIYDHFADAECWYLIMDFIEGKTLEQYLDEMGEVCFPIEEVLNLAIQLCTVLDYLHTRQPHIVFRDLKPTNIMFTRNGHLFLIDFGIARHFKPGQAKDTIPFGSPGYAAPEQYGKTQTTPSADIYSLGATLHQLLSGSDPTQAPFCFAPLQWQGHPLLAQLERLVMQMLEMNPASRPANIAVIKEQLQDIAARWANRYRRGLQAQVPNSQMYQPTGIVWQSNPPTPQRYVGSATTYAPHPTPSPVLATVAGARQMSQMVMLRQAIPATGASFVAPGRVMPGIIPASLPQRNGAAAASLTLGIVSFGVPLLFFFLPFFYRFIPFSYLLSVVLIFLTPILAVIFGHIGLHRAHKYAHLKSSDGLAIAGMVIGYLLITLYALCSLLPLIFFALTRVMV